MMMKPNSASKASIEDFRDHIGRGLAPPRQLNRYARNAKWPVCHAPQTRRSVKQLRFDRVTAMVLNELIRDCLIGEELYARVPGCPDNCSAARNGIDPRDLDGQNRNMRDAFRQSR